jgi:outer membrane receptor protein involved in Fe transport
MKKMKLLQLAGASLFALSANAHAQDAPAQPAASAQAAPAPAQDEGVSAAKAEDIIVTGSRVISNGNNSPTPVTIVSTQALAVSTPSSIPDALRKLPVFGNNSSSTRAGNAGGNAQGNVLNLRAFGANRTLILFDGHRVPATSADGTVDTNTLPQLLIQRIDVVTGGASAVYGSDAVTGVVNFVLDTKFEGLKAVAQRGISQYGDAGSYRVGFAGGMKLGDRGHVEVSYERFRQAGIDNKFDRAAGQKVYLMAGNGTTVPYHLISDARATTASFGGLIGAKTVSGGTVNSVLAGMNFTQNGVLSPFVHGAASGTNGIESGGDGYYNINTSISGDVHTDQAFGRFDYDLTDTIKFHAQSSYSRSYNANNFGPPLLTNYTISSDNAFLPATAKAAMAAAGQNTFLFSRSIADQPGWITQSRTQSVNATAGLDGKLGDFDWDLFYTHGWSRQNVRALNNVNNGKLAAALDAVRDPASGNVVCRVTLTNPSAYPGCVPINLFGPSSESTSAYQYATNTTQFWLTNKVEDVGGSISGSPFSTWAGPVKVALSGEYRHLNYDVRTTANPNSHPDCTGLRYNCTATTVLYLNNTVAPVSASQDIAEGAIEANVPLLRDVRFFKSLDLNGAFRYAHYTTVGNAKTWKIGGDWHVNDELSFRATRSQDIRAPNLNDLFSPFQSSYTGFNDLHTNIAQGIFVSRQGNPNLKPETAQTLTVGTVYRPAFLPRFSVSVDYYNIKLKDAIVSLGGNSASSEQACEDSGGTSPICAFYVRPLPFSDKSAANFPTAVTSGALNVANVRTKGIDSEFNYAVPAHLGDSPSLNGTFNLRALFTYQPVLTTTQFAGAPAVKAAGVAGQGGQSGVAKYRMTAFLNYTTDVWSLDLQERWRSHLAQSGTPNLTFLTPKVPAAAYTDLTVSAKVGEKKNFEVFLSVQNLLNRKAAVYIATAYSSNPNFYYPAVDSDDVIGRYFTTGVRVRF